MLNAYRRIVSRISDLLKRAEAIDEGTNAPTDERDLQISKEQGYEEKDVNVFSLFMTGFVLVIGAVCLQVILSFGFFYLKNHPGAPEVALESNGQTEIAPADFLNSSVPEKELADYQDEMHRVLKSYGWVDRTKGVVRIPIDQAMRRLSHEN